eukprot:Hpha_TRINITY_DN14814_c0_g2::TRINITY_DN14814_c0_g2_i1::g.169670::m.169670
MAAKMFRASNCLAAMLGVQGAMKLWQREADVEAFKQVGMSNWQRNSMGEVEALGALTILVPPLRPIGVFLASASAGNLLALGTFNDRAAVQEAVRKYTAPIPEDTLCPCGDNRNIALTFAALQLLLAEWVAAASGQRPLWLAAGFASGCWHGAGGWAQYPKELRELADYNLPEIVQRLQDPPSTPPPDAKK